MRGSQPPEGPFLFSAGQNSRDKERSQSNTQDTGTSMNHETESLWIQNSPSAGVPMTKEDRQSIRSLTKRACYSRETLKGAIAGAAVMLFLVVVLAVSLSRHAALKFSLSGSAQDAQNGTCKLTPERAEGPYYLQEELFRADIVEGQVGVPLLLRFTLQTSDCQPLQDVYVDIWHCNATGVYSGFTKSDGKGPGPGPGKPPKGDKPPGGGPPHANQTDDTTFMRGTLLTDSAGMAEFVTIVPGWYAGRAPHIHMKVHVPDGADDNGADDHDADSEEGDADESEAEDYKDSHVSHTGQVFFAEALYTQIEGMDVYSTNPVSRKHLNDDDIYNNDKTAILTITQLDIAAVKYGLIGTATIVIDPTATPPIVRRK